MRTGAHLLALIVFALVPVLARAQAAPNPVVKLAIQAGLEVKRDGDRLENAPVLYVTKADCDRNAEYEFTVRYTGSVDVSEAWVGAGAVVDCSAPFNRIRASSAMESSVCKLVGRNLGTSRVHALKMRAVDLFSQNTPSRVATQEDADHAQAEAANRDDEAPASSCDELVNFAYTLFFIPLPEATDTLANTTYAPISGVGYETLTASFTLYTSLPPAPSRLLAESGATEIGVHFYPIPGAPVSTRYRAYFDWGSRDGQECGSGVLLGDLAAPHESATIAAVSTATSSAKLADLDDRGIPPETEVAVAVVTVDPAGNESLLSPPVCVTRIPDETCADASQSPSKCKGHAGSCSVRPTQTGQAHGTFASTAWLVAALVQLRRRKSSFMRHV